VVLAPVAGVKLAEAKSPDRVRQRLESADDGDKKNSSPGRARNRPLKPLRRKRRVIPAVPVATTLVCFLHFAHGAAGAAKHPAFPAPSVISRARTTRARCARRECEVVSSLRASGSAPTGRANARPMTGSEKQSRVFAEILDCFVASAPRNDGELFDM
jgi:hypothetical protein